MSKAPNAIRPRLEIDLAALGRAVDWLTVRHRTVPVDSAERSVRLVYVALLELLAEPFFGKIPDPSAFKIAAEAIARRVRDLSPADRLGFVDPSEIEECIAALVAGGAFVVLKPGDPQGRGPRDRAPLLQLVGRS